MFNWKKVSLILLAFSRFGSIKLGDVEKPQYTAFQWGSMMFTAGLAADILFYSLCEWMLYAGNRSQPTVPLTDNSCQAGRQGRNGWKQGYWQSLPEIS